MRTIQISGDYYLAGEMGMLDVICVDVRRFLLQYGPITQTVVLVWNNDSNCVQFILP